MNAKISLIASVVVVVFSEGQSVRRTSMRQRLDTFNSRAFLAKRGTENPFKRSLGRTVAMGATITAFSAGGDGGALSGSLQSANAAESGHSAKRMGNVSSLVEDTEKSEPVYLTQGENILLGGVGGMLKSYLLMPFATWKYCLQEGRALPRSLPEWYRGVVPNAAFMVPVTIAQIWTNGFLESIVSNGGTRELSNWEKIGIGVAAGAASALLYGPMDLLVIQQQKLKLGLVGTLKHITKEYGALKLFRGIKASVVREGVYAGGYLGLAPVLADIIRSKEIPGLDGNFLSQLAGSIVAGLTASIISHPVDTAKTNIQADILGVRYSGTVQSVGAIYRESGIESLYKGGVARCLQVSAAVYVLSDLRARALRWKEQKLRKEKEVESVKNVKLC